MDQAAAQDAALKTRAVEAQPAMAEIPQYQLSLLPPSIDLNLIMSTAVEPTKQIRDMAENAGKQKVSEILQTADNQAAMKAAAAAVSGGAPGPAAASAVAVQTKAQQPQPAPGTVFQYPLQLLLEVDPPGMDILLAQVPERGVRDAAEKEASAAGKQLLGLPENVAAIVDAACAALASINVAAGAAPTANHAAPQQVLFHVGSLPPLPAPPPPTQKEMQAGSDFHSTASPANPLKPLHTAAAATAAAASEQQRLNATSPSAAACSAPQRTQQPVNPLAAAQQVQEPQQVDKTQQAATHSAGVGTRKTSVAAADTHSTAAAATSSAALKRSRRRNSAASEVPSGQVMQQDTVPAAASQATPVKVGRTTRQQSKTSDTHEGQQQQPSGAPGAARSSRGAKRARGEQNAAAAASHVQPSPPRQRTRKSQAAVDGVAVAQHHQQNELSTADDLGGDVDQQQQPELPASVSAKAHSGKARGRGRSSTAASEPAAQKASAGKEEPVEPADAALAVIAVADQEIAAGNSRKRGRSAASATKSDNQAATSGAAAGSTQQAAGSAGRRDSTRKPLAQTQPPTVAAATAGTDTEEAAAVTDSKPSKRPRKSQTGEQEQQAVKKQSVAAEKSVLQQPAGSGRTRRTSQHASGLSAAALAVVPQRATNKLTEKEKLYQQVAAAGEYPSGWQAFPDTGKDKAESSAVAADKDQKEKDSEFAAAVAAADLPHLAPGPGQLRQDTQGCCYRKNIPDLSVYRLGDPTGHHAKLWRKTDRDGTVYWEQLSTSCHDCQHQHVRWDCPDPQHALTAGSARASYCNRCLFVRYRHTTHCLSALHQSCPRCRGMCTCKSCLRQPDHAGRVATGGYTAEELGKMGEYVLKFVGPSLKQWLQQQEEEAAAGGHENLALVPVERLSDQERMNCDRCGTNLVGLFAHCSVEDCQWDICYTCMRELREQQQQQGQAQTTCQFKWTCCNPKCSSTAKAIMQEQKPKQQQQQDIHQQEQQDQASEGKAAAGPSGDPAGPAAPAADGTADDPARSPGGRQRRKSAKQLECEETARLLKQDTAEPKRDSEIAAAKTALEAAVMSRRCAEVGHGVHGDELHCVPDAADLELRFMLPADLLQVEGESSSSSNVLQQLRQIAEAYGAFQPSQLKLSDCPYLPPGAPLIPATTEAPAASAGVAAHNTVEVDVASSAALGAARDFTLSDLMSDDWWRVLPDGLRSIWRRKANSTVYLFTPDAKDLDWPVENADDGGDDGDGGIGVPFDMRRVTLARLVFWGRWLVRDPVIVRGLKGRIPWDPETMARAMKNFNASEQCVTVMDCADFHKIDGVKAATFFRGYSEGFWRKSDGAGSRARAVTKDVVGAEPAMLKVKDWPPADEFRKELPRHFMDFIERLPTRYYTDPRLGHGPLNLSSCLAKSDNPTDLGPKGYLAYGRWREATAEGDSVTKMHLDMTDAINMLVDVQPGGDAVARQRAAAAATAAEGGVRSASPSPALAACCVRSGEFEPDKPGYGGAGAVWDIVRQSDVAAVSYFLSSHAHEFIHQGAPVSVSPCSAAYKNPALSQYFMLVEHHRQKLREFLPERPVEMLHFEQHLDEGVYIPGGCPHQVRNLQSCTKVAVDYVSPEALRDCLAQRMKLRELDLWCGEPLKAGEDGERIGPSDRDYAEKLQSQLIMLRAALTAAGLSADPQVKPTNVEPELPVVAADARVTRIAAKPVALAGRTHGAATGVGAAPDAAAEPVVQGQGAGSSSSRRRAGSGARSANSSGRGRGRGRGRGAGGK